MELGRLKSQSGKARLILGAYSYLSESVKCNFKLSLLGVENTQIVAIEICFAFCDAKKLDIQGHLFYFLCIISIE